MRLSQRLLGWVLVVGGLTLAAAGVVQLIAEEASTTTTVAASPTTAATTTTTTQPTTTTTTTAPTTTVITSPPQSVEDFVSQYRAALDSDDVEFVFGRLHPVVVEAYGAELCRAWVEDEVITLEEYELVGVVAGPHTSRVSIPGGEADIPKSFSATVSFVFQGSSFEAEAGFALVDGQMHWLGVCR